MTIKNDYASNNEYLNEFMENEILRNNATFRAAGAHRINAADVLATLTKSIEGEFAHHLDPLIKLAKSLSPLSGNILEFHFDRSDGWFDLAVRVSKHYDKPFLNHLLVPENNSRYILEGYQYLFDRKKYEFKYGIENIWFEYDFPFQNNPSLFFDVRRNNSFPPERIFEDLGRLTTFFNYPCYPQLLTFFAKIKSQTLHVVYYGLMFSRKSRALRLTINGLQPGNLIDVLKDLKWKGNYDGVMNLKSNYLKPSQKIVLAVDFDTELRTRIGIEVFDSDLGSLLARLFKNRILDEEQHTLLKKWPGNVPLPRSISIALTQLHRRTINSIYRRINHIKFIIDKDTVKTKAYLYFCF